ncbi:MAG: chromosome segregation protein SMC [Lysobacterales bacterium]
MRLKTIKLSGFKSFVDPTTFHLPSHLIGVVGPNGCGKSNIIDAVRWVMGESSPRLLRGDSMSDVIFNGSNARKPVGQAMVELVFDNSEGKLTGEYSAFGEISIRRTVSREGQSQYFLNGTRCRRRDITDLFLGTGLGPRSYSIIEQGMISQLVEARPEELRVYLEEAAGISKYKERRRETENRIRHTRENLERLDDLRGEVESQLKKLDRQAKQAEKYKDLKEQARQGEAQLLALNCSVASDARTQAATALSSGQTEVEASIAKLRAFEADLETARQQQGKAFESVNAVQGELYETGASIARLEQSIAHRKELNDQQSKEQQDLADNLQSLREHLDLDRVHGEQLGQEIGELEPALEAARKEENHALDTAQSAEQALAQWQAQWDEHSQSSSDSNREADVERTKIGHLDQQLVDAGRRLEKLAEEKRAVATEDLKQELETLSTQRDAISVEAKGLEQTVESLRTQMAERSQELSEVDVQLAASRDSSQQAKGRLSSLHALQQGALESGADGEWLNAQGLANAPRLAGQIRVDAEWETAAETVLGPLLDACVVENLGALGGALREMDSGSISLVDSGSAERGPAGTLAAHISGPAAVVELASQVRLTGDLAEALGQRETLQPGQSLITPSGQWVGRRWLQVNAEGDASGGVIAREREIAELGDQLEAMEKQIGALTERRAELTATLNDLQFNRDETARELSAKNRQVAETAGRADGISARLKHLDERSERITSESAELAKRIAVDQSAVAEARTRLEGNVETMAQLEDRRSELAKRRADAQSEFEQARQNANKARMSAHEMALQLESKRSALTSTQQSLGRSEEQIQSLLSRSKELEALLETSGQPIEEDEKALQAELENRKAVEAKLVERRKQSDEQGAKIQQLDQSRREAGVAEEQARDQLQKLKLEQEGHRVRLEGLTQQLSAGGFELEALLETLPEGADPEAMALELERLSTRITRLEPVNLAAIEEFEEQSERKRYLDEQNDDLNRALETLEEAIHTIDKKTRTRFKETYDEVNDGFKELFPKLFGGGHGFLELSGDDLLTSGVAIMARPPGKRVSNIHLLSGGEKALTAVALVFAIFRLNPAPFCMLDEVDAPLDDANVGRFTEMVKHMSETVQFLMVTHNKVTMEAAHQLLGVTMAEAGVSRLVSVDIAEAARMVDG